MWRRARRWIRRIVLGTLATIVVVIGVALIVLHTDWGREQLRARAVAALHAQFPGGVQIQKIEGSVVGDLVLRDVVLRDADGRSAVTAKVVRLNVGYASLFTGEIELETLTIDGLTVDARLREGQPPNLATIYQPSPDPFTWDVALRRVVVHDAQITIDRDGQIEHVDDLEIAAIVTLVAATGALDASVTIDGMLRERAAALAIAAVARVDADGVSVPSASVTVGQASIVATAVTYRSLTDLRGAVVIHSPVGELARLAPELGLIGLPIDVKAEVVPAAGDGLQLTLSGAIAGALLGGKLIAHPTAPRPRVDGTLTVASLDLMRLGPALPPSDLAATIAIGVEIDPAVTGLAAARGEVELTGHGTVAEVALDDVRVAAALADGAAALELRGKGPGGTVVTGSGRLVAGKRLTLVDGHLVATVASLAKASRGEVPADGAVELTVDLDGAFLGGEATHLDATVAIAGRGLRSDDLRVGAVDVTATVSGAPTGLTGEARVAARGIRKGGQPLPDVVVTARGGMTGPIAVQLDASDRRRGVQAAVGATVTLGGDDPARVADVVLGDYRVAMRGAAIGGRGGRITLERERVIVRDVRATGAGGTLAIDAIAGLGVRAGQLEGTIALDDLDLTRARGLPGVAPHVAGIVDFHAALKRRGSAIEGEVQASAHGLVVTAGAQPIDVAFSAELRPKRVEVAITADGAELGTLSAAIDVVPPRRFDDLAAWVKLDRKALRAVRLDARALDLARLAQLVGRPPTVEGTLDAALDLDATHASLKVRGHRLIAAGVPAPVDLEVDLDLTDPTTAAIAASATLREVGTATVKAAVALPSRPFDLAAWAAVDLRAVQGVEIAIDDVEIDDAMARRLGLGDVRGVVAATITAEPGLRAVTAHIVARELIAGPLAKPVALTIDAAVGKDGTRATVEVGLEGATVAVIDASTPTTVAALLAGGLDLAAVPITAKVRIPDSALAPFARAMGQAARLGGRVRGEATFAGTLAAPTGTLALVITNLASRIPRDGGPPRGGLPELTVDARYTAGAIHGELRGRQDDGGALRIVADVDPARLGATRASITATKFQLAPLARLAPSILLGVRGLLDADLQLLGADLRTARLQGVATLTGVQVPLSDSIGNLRDATVALSFQAGSARLAVNGAVESGRVSATGTATLDGLLPRSAKLDVTVKSLSLITSLAPRFGGKLHVEVEPTGAGDRWKATARITDGEVTIPDEEGRELHPAGLPPDLVFTSDTRVGVPVPQTQATALKAWLGVRPSDPIITLALDIAPVTVLSSQFRGEVAGKLDFAIGADGASVDGRIAVARGNVVLFERRYSLRDAALVFDGSIDPLLAIQLEYEFPQLAMRVVLGGRLTKPTLQLSSSPSTYTEGQLLGFLLGGSPGLAGRETVDAATGVAAAVASQVIGGFVTRKLPIRLDVLNYEPASAASSGAFVFGRWLTTKLLVLFRTRVEARVDENVSEAQAEYWLNQRLLLDGTAGDRGVLGLDLLWNRRW